MLCAHTPETCERVECVMAQACKFPTYECHKQDTNREVYFYEQDFYVLSNFSSFKVAMFGMHFMTAEHAYHWNRFERTVSYRGEPAAQTNILLSRSAHDAFTYAQQTKHLQNPLWDNIKVQVMRGIIRAKALQHEYVKRKLLDTGERTLIEDSWRDAFWGWGPNRDGQNWLGKLWMELRNDFRVGKEG